VPNYYLIIVDYENTYALLDVRNCPHPNGVSPLETQRPHAGVNGNKEFKENLEVY